jgi:hypothetical protein
MVREPEANDQVTTVVVEIVRGGDVNQSCSVRTSTRDGSAVSGLDYSASSKILTFAAGEVIFPVALPEICPNIDPLGAHYTTSHVPC